MTHLAKALKKYYRKEGNKLVFQNAYSLNQLALEMWERMGFHGIDTSSLSRVASGKRLFTQNQLKTFCDLLSLKLHEREDLFHALYLDTLKKFDIRSAESLTPSFDSLDFIQSLLDKELDFLTNGNYHELNGIVDIVQEYLEELLNKNPRGIFKRKIYSQLARNLHYKTRAIATYSSPSNVFFKTGPLIKKLSYICGKTRSSLHWAYIDSLSAMTYYIEGDYSRSLSKRKNYLSAFRLAKQAYNSLPQTDDEKFIAMRVMVMSLVYLKDRLTFESMKNDLLALLGEMSNRNQIYGIFIYNTIARSMNFFHSSKAQLVRDYPQKNFRKTLRGRHGLEIADIRDDLELASTLKRKNYSLVENLVKRGLEIAELENYQRHQRNILKLAGKLL